MKKFILFTLIAFINGCGTNLDNKGAFLSKEILERSTYYISDRCYQGNEYAKYNFFDHKYIKVIFEDDDLTSISKTIEDKIEYIDMFDIVMYEKGEIFDCVVEENGEHSVRLYCINRKFKSDSDYYHIQKTLWDSKNSALEYKDIDCNF